MTHTLHISSNRSVRETLDDLFLADFVYPSLLFQTPGCAMLSDAATTRDK